MLVVQVGPEVQEVLLVCSESRPMVEIRSELVLLEPPVEVDPLVEPEVDHQVGTLRRQVAVVVRRTRLGRSRCPRCRRSLGCGTL